MSDFIRALSVSHINVVVEDFDASVAHFRRLYGADLLMDLPQAEWHAGLVEIGRVIFELFVPRSFLLNSRYGPHYLGIEYQADMGEVREVLARNGIRIARDIGLALHTHPADGLGIAFEFYDGGFHERAWPLLGGRKMRSAAYWRDEHPLGATGLKGCTVAVADLDVGIRFLRNVFGAEVSYRAVHAGLRARSAGLQVADGVIELMEPDGAGPLQDHLHRYGQGIRSSVLGVRDLEQARRYFVERGIALTSFDEPDRFAVLPQHNLGLLFEFTE
jgi:catechol 2,3-dioxygenase-like lactoylglutathione lyase family enzyme